MMTPSSEPNVFPGLIDLASERLGGKALIASDDFFAPVQNLLKTGRGVFVPDKYTPRGKWMDGWESRRKRAPGHDWCIVKLGVPGMIRGFDIDTNHFLGNNPWYASIEACEADGETSVRALTSRKMDWKQILPRSPLKPGSQNIFAVASTYRWTHVRLNIFPDGGVARFRVYGDALPDWKKYRKNQAIDLAAVENGGLAVAASDMFFSPMNNLITPGRADSMGGGWETRRRRGPGNDWVIVRLGKPGLVQKIEVDTNHFKGNYPDSSSIDSCFEPAAPIDALSWPSAEWKELLPKTKLYASKRHVFAAELRVSGPTTHVRLNIFPDGGVSRLRVIATVA